MITFDGLAVALATPFTQSGELDLPAFRKLVRHVVNGGTDVLIPLGTTGEAATLDESERDIIINATLEEAGDAKVVVGTGSNNTKLAAAQTVRAQELGAHGALVVTPWYNKPTLGGLVAHYAAVTEAAPGLPIILYNVPGRTGLNVTAAMLNVLWENPSIVAVKESSGNLTQISEIGRTLPHGKTLLSGDDPFALASIAVGAEGLVSVLGNAFPAETKALVDAARAGRREEAMKHHYRLTPIIEALFVESSPIPLKALLAEMGFGSDFLRLPMVPAQSETRERLRKVTATLSKAALV